MADVCAASSSQAAVAHKRMRAGFATGITASLDFRIEQLRRLRAFLLETEDTAFAALASDMGKSRLDVILGELGPVHSEVTYFIRHLSRLAKGKTVKTGGESLHLQKQPLGTILIISPFNFPINLALKPLVGALAAGNTVVLKPAETTPATEQYLCAVQNALDDRVCAVTPGGPDVATELLSFRWDHILYTGGGFVGRIVAKAAAKNLTPTTLELGGKSPAIVTSTADVKETARSVVWGKFFNSGQVCLAIDYVLIDDQVYDAFVDALLSSIPAYFNGNPKASTQYCRIVSERHTKRIMGLVAETCGKIIYGGGSDRADKYIEPTVVELGALNEAGSGAAAEDVLMQQEIFGPILPLVRVPSIDTAITFVNNREKPLALYVFGGKDDEATRKVLASTSSGSAGVNVSVLQVSRPGSFLGGVGESGIGTYGGEASFDTFSHTRPVMRHGAMNAGITNQGFFAQPGADPVRRENLFRFMLGIPMRWTGGKPVEEFLRDSSVLKVAAGALAASLIAVLLSRR